MENTALTSIDISQSYNIYSVHFNDNSNITTLNLKTGTAFIDNTDQFHLNPALTYVCANADDVAPLMLKIQNEPNAATIEVNADCNVLGTPDFAFGSFLTLYPNPATAVLNIDYNSNINIETINVYNPLGQLVLVVPNAKGIERIDVSKLVAGNYFIRVTSDKGSSNARFVKVD